MVFMATTTSSTVKTPQVGLTYSHSDHSFTVTATNTKSVNYTLSYLAAETGATVPQALTNAGKGDAKNAFSATHLAGTESNGQKVIHTVKEGALELKLESIDGTQYAFTKVFTVTTAGQLKFISQAQEKDTTSRQGQVQGASTTSAVLNDPLTTTGPIQTIDPNLPINPVPMSSPQVISEPVPSATSQSVMSRYVPLLFFTAGILVLVAVLGMYLKNRSARAY